MVDVDVLRAQQRQERDVAAGVAPVSPHPRGGPSSRSVTTADALLLTGSDLRGRAFADHGEGCRLIDPAARDAADTLRRADAAGIDLPALAELEREGVRAFCDSCHQLLSCIETKRPQGGLAGARNRAARR